MTRKRLAPYLEIVFLAATLAAVNLLVWPNDPGFTRVSPHPMLFLTLLVVARYGFAPGVVMALVAAAEYAAMFLFLSKRPSFELLAPPNSTPLVVLVPVTVFLGMLVERHLDRRRKAEAEAARARDQVEELQGSIGSLHDINRELGGRIVNTQTTRLMLVEELKALATLDRAHLETAFARAIAETLGAQAVSVWRVEHGELALAAQLGAPPSQPLRVAVERHFGDSDLVAAQDVQVPGPGEALPFLLGRVRAGKGGAVTSFVAVDGLALESAPEAMPLFASLVEWFTTAMGHAAELERLRGQPRTGARR